jgi:hypothetical protein
MVRWRLIAWVALASCGPPLVSERPSFDITVALDPDGRAAVMCLELDAGLARLAPHARPPFHELLRRKLGPSYQPVCEGGNRFAWGARWVDAHGCRPYEGLNVVARSRFPDRDGFDPPPACPIAR